MSAGVVNTLHQRNKVKQVVSIMREELFASDEHIP